MNSKGRPGPRRNPLGMPASLPESSDSLVSINESQEDEVSVEHNSPQLRDFLIGSDLTYLGRGQLLRAQLLTKPQDREALVQRIAYYQYWATKDNLYSEHVLRATMFKFGLSAQITNQVLKRQPLPHPSDRVALLDFIDKLVPQRTSSGGTRGAKVRGRK